MTMERVKNCFMAMSGGTTSVAFVAKAAAPANLLSEVGSDTVNPFRARVVSLFQKHNPGKLSDVDSLVANYEGWEDAR
jgi:ABC-type phosphate transport system substrate-binding protein